MKEYWDIPNNFGTSVSEFERYVGRKPKNEEEMEQWVHSLKKGIETQLDWEIICTCASDNFPTEEDEEEEIDEIKGFLVMDKECLWYNGDGQYELLDFDPNGLTREQVIEKAKQELQKRYGFTNEEPNRAMETLYLLDINSLDKLREGLRRCNVKRKNTLNR